MNVNKNFLLTNPFIDAYIQSDFLGKVIFMALITLSIISWIVIVYKCWLLVKIKKESKKTKFFFKNHTVIPLTQENSFSPVDPFNQIYQVAKKTTLDLLSKNYQYNATTFLSRSDIELIEGQLQSQIAQQTKILEKNLFFLSTIVSLAPFLGLLGTVWGILITFAGLQNQGMSQSNQVILGGLSLALSTTVIGLIDAIPALIGYNYLKNTIYNYEMEMQTFSTDMLSSVEMQYRKVDA
ncbi:Biopolymer transport protein ExbB [Candidatus Rubidus massiliensis]|nr:MAG: TolQ protein [Chlamydia sp. 32-24]CDZ79824.1 Biopolymer transport protein ExbB [Candidatus Rubidus massiliensis]